MKRRDAISDAVAEGAAGRFVSFDAGAPGAGADLAAWVEERPANERALERVELAVELGRRLASDPHSALRAEAANVVRSIERRRIATASLGFGGAMAAALVVAVLVARDPLSTGSAVPAAISAARLVAVDAPSNPVVVLPTGVVVDASAVAVLPFAAVGDATLARGLQRDVAGVLRTVPGLYVIADAAVSSYAITDLGPSEIGAQLGARGIVNAAVELVDGRVRVGARLRETATGATLWQADVDRPVDELRAVRDEIANQIAAAMLDSSLRAQLARADVSSAAVASKPLMP
jgi:TolB-like protein